MRRRVLLLLLVPLGGALAIFATKPRSEADALRDLFPELSLAAHAKEGTNEAWLFTGKARADAVARRLDAALKGRSGWVTPLLKLGETFAYGNHYSPLADPRLMDRLPFRAPDRRPVLDVHVMVGRAMRGDQGLPHGPEWATMQIQATPPNATFSGTGANPLDDWIVYR